MNAIFTKLDGNKARRTIKVNVGDKTHSFAVPVFCWLHVSARLTPGLPKKLKEVIFLIKSEAKNPVEFTLKPSSQIEIPPANQLIKVKKTNTVSHF